MILSKKNIKGGQTCISTQDHLKSSFRFDQTVTDVEGYLKIEISLLPIIPGNNQRISSTRYTSFTGGWNAG